MPQIQKRSPSYQKENIIGAKKKKDQKKKGPFPFCPHGGGERTCGGVSSTGTKRSGGTTGSIDPPKQRFGVTTMDPDDDAGKSDRRPGKIKEVRGVTERKCPR